jgi:hypothetical protein
MASWLMRRMLRNRGRASLLDRRGIFVLFVDIVRASCIAVMRMRFADGVGGDVVVGSGSMRVAWVILGAPLGCSLAFCVGESAV